MEKDCNNCKFELYNADEIPCKDCGMEEREYWQPKPQTNADRIRAMSDEELANWLARTQYANMMEAAEIFGEQLPFEEETLKGSEQECLQWLKQPADMRGEEE